ncbi:MAG: hypothetical protein PHS19_05845 [Eubacteriales bacterium]|nr:hypothetical protein [Eubacteriales bacterium]
MLFIVYSQVSEEQLNHSLGMPEYSYYFVLRGFLPVLRELGKVILVSDPEQEVDAIYDDCLKRGEECVFLTFSPPNKSATGLHCPTISVLAWEYDRIPETAWDDDPKNDWRNVFKDHGRTITLSQYSADAVRKAMGENFPVEAIPVPVWDAFEAYRIRNKCSWPAVETEITIKGNIVDSRNYHITDDSFELTKSADSFQIQNWCGEALHLGFTQTDEFSAYLGGFYPAEPWGSWSRIDQPWVLFPYKFSGVVHLKISACGYGYNVNKEIFISIGDDKKQILLKGDYNEIIRVSFQLPRPGNMLKFSGLDLSPVPNAPDPRSMGIGLRYIEISGEPSAKSVMVTEQADNAVRNVTLDGVVYTSIFNPTDGRKNWKDIVIAFCTAFQDVHDATLVLKMTNHSLASFLGELHFYFQQLGSFKCRIVALHGFMEAEEYEKLIAATHFYVNASKCEGLCLPLMEYMACCKPAIAPCHTAMADYIDSSSGLVVDSNLEPCILPHERCKVFGAMRYRINWESLANAYRQSYNIVKNKPETYREMAKAASLQIKKFASSIVVKEKLKIFLTKELGCSF